MRPYKTYKEWMHCSLLMDRKTGREFMIAGEKLGGILLRSLNSDDFEIKSFSEIFTEYQGLDGRPFGEEYHEPRVIPLDILLGATNG